MAFGANLASLFVNIVVNSSRAVTNIQRVQQGLQRTTLQARQMQLQFAKIRTTAAVFYVLQNVLRLVSTSLTEIVQTAAEVERAFSRIKSAGNFDTSTIVSFKKELLDLSEKLRIVPVQNLQGIALAGAQAGISNPKQLLKFSEDVAKAAQVAEGISSESLARFALLVSHLFKTPIEDTDKLTNALRALAVGSKTTEAEIVRVASVILGAGQIFGLTVAETLALAEALRDVGVTAERATSFVSKMFNDLAVNPQKFQDILGLDAGFSNRVKSAPQAALLEVLKAISIQGTNTGQVLDALDYSERRISLTTQQLTQTYASYIKAIALAKKEIQETDEVERAFNEQVGDTQGAIDSLSTAWTRLKTNMGDAGWLTSLINKFADLIDVMNKNPFTIPEMVRILNNFQNPEDIKREWVDKNEGAGNIWDPQFWNDALGKGKNIFGGPGGLSGVFGGVNVANPTSPQGSPLGTKREITPPINLIEDINAVNEALAKLADLFRPKETEHLAEKEVDEAFAPLIEQIKKLAPGPEQDKLLEQTLKQREAAADLARAEEHLADLRKAGVIAIEKQEMREKQLEEKQKALGDVADFLATPKQSRILDLQENFLKVTEALKNADPGMLFGGENQEEIGKINAGFDFKRAELLREGAMSEDDLLEVLKQQHLGPMDRDTLDEINKNEEARQKALANVKGIPGILPDLQKALTQQLAGLGGTQAQFSGLTEAWERAQLKVFDDQKEIPILTLKQLQIMKELEQKNLPALPRIEKKLDNFPAQAG